MLPSLSASAPAKMLMPSVSESTARRTGAAHQGAGSRLRAGMGAPGTEHADSKRLLAEHATLVREGHEDCVELRLRGGKALALDAVPLNRPRYLKHPVCPATVAALDAGRGLGHA